MARDPGMRRAAPDALQGAAGDQEGGVGGERRTPVTPRRTTRRRRRRPVAARSGHPMRRPRATGPTGRRGRRSPPTAGWRRGSEKSRPMAGSAMPTTVASMAVMADPRTVAARTQRPGAVENRSSTGPGVELTPPAGPGRRRRRPGGPRPRPRVGGVPASVAAVRGGRGQAHGHRRGQAPEQVAQSGGGGKYSSSSVTWTSSTPWTGARRATTASTSSSGADAPAVTPTVPERSSGSSAASFTRSTSGQPEARGHLFEGAGVGGVHRADHDDRVGARRDHLQRGLTVRGGEAQVRSVRHPQVREPRPWPGS